MIDFFVTVLREDGTQEVSIDPYPDAATALADQMERFGHMGRIEVRPAVERTREDGRRRYPHPLHVNASAEARLGWASMRTELDVALTDHVALSRQVQHQHNMEHLQ